MELDLDIIDEAGDWATLSDAEQRADVAARAAFAAVAEGDGQAEACIVLNNNDAVQTLNRDHRGQDKPTNVLSFAALEGDMLSPPGAPVLLGDIVLAYETVMDEAAREGKTPGDHFSHLIVHGMLHLLGFDHQDDADAQIMEDLEVSILKNLGIENPYEGTQ